MQLSLALLANALVAFKALHYQPSITSVSSNWGVKDFLQKYSMATSFAPIASY